MTTLRASILSQPTTLQPLQKIFREIQTAKMPLLEKNPRDGYFSMGDHTYKVPMALFAENRSRLAAELRKTPGLPPRSMVLLQAGGEQGVCAGDSSDVGPVFRQESFFHWTFGVLQPDYYGVVDVATGKSILFMVKLAQVYATWMGDILSPSDVKEMYRVDEVHYIEDMVKVLKSYDGPTLLTLKGQNSDSKKMTLEAAFDGISQFEKNNSILHHVMSELRVIKTPMELDVLRYVAEVSAQAHKAVMRGIKSGMKEYMCESLFRHHSYTNGGCRHVSYTCICGSGNSGSILHYGHAEAPNDQDVKEGDIVLFDMGAEYYCFCSDVTCSYPVSGKFTENQKLIYNAVYRSNQAVMKAVKPGVKWTDMHLLANRIILEDLKAGGLLKGDLEEMMGVNLAGEVFMPHGLGHFMGNDVHCVGGYLEGHPERPKGTGIGNIRTARVLKENMVMTIEPGCYFQDYLLDKALADPKYNKFMNADRINEFRGFGGVRIEDDVIITKDGCENMSIVPRTVEEIEDWMAGKGDK